jgi:hypothetical protein
MVIIQLRGASVIQWVVFMYFGFANLIYLIFIQPQTNKRLWALDLYNESCVIIIGFSCLPMTTLYPPDKDRITLCGKMVIMCFISVAIVNWIFIVIETVIELK